MFINNNSNLCQIPNKQKSGMPIVNTKLIFKNENKVKKKLNRSREKSIVLKEKM